MVGAGAAQPCPHSRHLQHCQGSSMHGEGAENGSKRTWPFFPAQWELDSHLWIAHSATSHCPRGLSSAKHFLLYHCTESLWPKPLLFLQALLKKMLYLHPATPCFAVVQLPVCWDHCLLYWQIQSQQFIVVSFLSVSFFSAYFILSLPAVCSRSFPRMCQPPPSAKAPTPRITKS